MERLELSTSKLYPKFFFNSDKKYFLSRSKNVFRKKNRKKIGKILENVNQKINIFQYFADFFRFFFEKRFLISTKKYFLSELKKNLGYSFDVESSNLSIYEVFRVFLAPQVRFPELPFFEDLGKYLGYSVPLSEIL